MTIIKRNGTEVSFDSEKIHNAIYKANQSTPGSKLLNKDVEEVTKKVVEQIEKLPSITVEGVQDFVEKELMKFGAYDVAKAYITYRYEHANLRQNNSTDGAIMALLDNKNEELNQENSNKNATIISTQRDYMAGEVSKDLAKRFLLPKEIWEAHKEGIIHFHDSDYFAQRSHNCDLLNLHDMLENSTVISGTKIDRPKTFATACNVATQIIAQVASSQYGGQTISLTHLAPFVEYSRQKITKAIKKELGDAINVIKESVIDQAIETRLKSEIDRGVQTLQYQILTLMTTNGQAPFVSVEMYLGSTDDPALKKDLALVIEEVLKQRIQGVKNEKGVFITPAFPKLLYVLEDDNVTPDSEYYYLTELAAKCSAKRLVPDYISEKKLLELKYPKQLTIRERRDMWGDEKMWGDNPFKKLTDEECELIQEEIDGLTKNSIKDLKPLLEKYGLNKKDLFPISYSPMGCRSFLTPDPVHFKHFGRFNQGVVTLNLVDIALSSKKDENRFWEIFDERLELCHTALRKRHERLLGTVSDVAPILWQHGAIARLEKGEKIDKLLFGNYSTISLGYAGLYECVKYMTDESHTSEKAKPFALKVMQYMNDACNRWKQAENISYSVYGTPIESTTYKFAKCLQKRFGIIPEITDHRYITNSYHINVREDIDAFSKLTFEGEFQELSPGGAISYVEVPNLQHNIPAVMVLIQHIYENTMYAELNTKSDFCMVCQYDGEIEIIEDSDKRLTWKCPNCGNTDQNQMSVARRTCGYIGVHFFNQGRTEEIKERVIHLS